MGGQTLKRFVLRNRMLRLIYRELIEGPMSPQAKHINIEGHDVVEVTFTDKQARRVIERADIKGIDAIKKGKKGPVISIDPMRSNRIGFLGQVAFYIYAFSDFEQGLQSIKIGYKPDVTDAIFRGWHIDVKTRTKAWHDLMMVPEVQFKKKHHDLYVGCRLVSEKPYVIQIWGYITRKELANIEPNNAWGHGLTRAQYFKNLHPIINLKDLKRKSATKRSKQTTLG